MTDRTLVPVSKSGRTTRENISIVLVVVMYIIATVHAATGWWLEVHSFANFGATPDIVDALVHNPVWYKAIGASMFALNILIADCLFVNSAFLTMHVHRAC